VCLARRAFFFFEKKESKKTLSEPLRRPGMILCKILDLSFLILKSLEEPKFSNGLFRKIRNNYFNLFKVLIFIVLCF